MGGAGRSRWWNPPITQVDALALLMCVICAVVGGLIAVYASGYMKSYHQHHREYTDRSSLFLSMLFVFMSAMFALVLSSNLIWIYFFWEITSRDLLHPDRLYPHAGGSGQQLPRAVDEPAGRTGLCRGNLALRAQPPQRAAQRCHRQRQSVHHRLSGPGRPHQVGAAAVFHLAVWSDGGRLPHPLRCCTAPRWSRQAFTCSSAFPPHYMAR